MSETPVGQAPATGGRVRQYASAAERARAFRDRQAAARSEAEQQPGLGGAGARPELAVASLAAAVASLQDLLAAAQAGMAEQVERAGAALALLSDPVALDERLELARADVGRQVAEAEDRVARARTDAGRARAAQEATSLERDAAVAAAAEAWEATAAAQDITTEAQDAQAGLQDQLTAQVTATQEAAARLDQLQRALTAEEAARVADTTAARTAAARAEQEATTRQQLAVDATEQVWGGRVEAAQQRLADAQNQIEDLRRTRDELRMDLATARTTTPVGRRHPPTDTNP